MKISVMIEKLKEIKEQEGDIEVAEFDYETNSHNIIKNISVENYETFVDWGKSNKKHKTKVVSLLTI